MDDNVAWVFEKKDVDQPRLCPQCGDPLEVTWHGTGYDYGCANFACPQLYFGPPYSEAELASAVPAEVRTPNCPRCLIPMHIVPDGENWQFACRQSGCDGIWPPTGS
ncbi:hypothetical protein [Cryobacterium sp. PH31-L1]|uniref:hypothetical protein n=1 Tax=Cryobacterium sp. PH31-L1 TaxID=3046199 RepID=UPI0024B93D7A|nr:hypothetical protein [Cryobacterium sp. PH31-L1]MDJ0376950.1 hypothetical protein [Cryobacterium sp. PH31-L1]